MNYVTIIFIWLVVIIAIVVETFGSYWRLLVVRGMHHQPANARFTIMCGITSVLGVVWLLLENAALMFDATYVVVAATTLN